MEEVVAWNRREGQWPARRLNLCTPRVAMMTPHISFAAKICFWNSFCTRMSTSLS